MFYVFLSFFLILFLNSPGIGANVEKEEGCERELRWSEKEDPLKIFVYCERELISDFISLHGAWEPKKFLQLSVLMSLFSTDERIALDIGANIGQFSLYLAGSLGFQVASFEPFPSNAALFRKSIAQNHLENHITLFEAGLSDRNSIMEAVVCEGNKGVVEILEPEKIADRKFWPNCCEWTECWTVSLPLMTLDESLLGYVERMRDMEKDSGLNCHFWQERPPVSLMKVDVEGHELAVLRGAAGLLSDVYARPRVIFLEYHITPLTMEKCEMIAKLLMEYGYFLFLTDNHSGLEEVLFQIPSRLDQLPKALEYVMTFGKVGIDLVAVTLEVLVSPEFKLVGSGKL